MNSDKNKPMDQSYSNEPKQPVYCQKAAAANEPANRGTENDTDSPSVWLTESEMSHSYWIYACVQKKNNSKQSLGRKQDLRQQ